jgi:hypothetical protein
VNAGFHLSKALEKVESGIGKRDSAQPQTAKRQRDSAQPQTMKA